MRNLQNNKFGQWKLLSWKFKKYDKKVVEASD